MIKKALVAVFSLGIVLVAVAWVLYARNPAPVVPEISAAEAAELGKPYVVKLHAQWCPVCMLTKSVWSRIEEQYATNVRYVVFDFTNLATTEVSRAQASRLGLEEFFDENAGSPGTISVLDGRTKEVTAVFHGSRDFDEYRAAIDATMHRADQSENVSWISD